MTYHIYEFLLNHKLFFNFHWFLIVSHINLFNISMGHIMDTWILEVSIHSVGPKNKIKK